MRQTGKRTRYPGVYQVSSSIFRIRATKIDRKKGGKKATEILLKDVDIKDAVKKRAELCRTLESVDVTTKRAKVGDYAKSWLNTKLATLSSSTADRYVDALEDHILHRTTGLGEFFFDALRRMDVQDWVNGEIRAGYAPATIQGWFNILRVLVRDAMADLGLQADPTFRVVLPEARERTAPNALTPDELSRFLAAMKDDRLYSRNYPLTVTLAFTGLRFCHASALKWEDLDFEKSVIRVIRRQVRGKVGPVSKKKRAPKELPLAPALAAILREHRERLVRRQNPGLAEGWVFPSLRGKLKTPGTLAKTWEGCLKAERFTVHGLRRTFNDLTRRAGADGIVTRALTGHVTSAMTEHYSTVGLDEKRAAVEGVVRLVPLSQSVNSGVNGAEEEKRQALAHC